MKRTVQYRGRVRACTQAIVLRNRPRGCKHPPYKISGTAEKFSYSLQPCASCDIALLEFIAFSMHDGSEFVISITGIIN